jgi:RNA polymerase sigma factor (sigma-70 family)
MGETTDGQSAKAGSHEGFAAFAYAQFRTGLHRYLLRRLRSADRAEDLAQEVYLRLLRFANRELVQCPEAYVYRVAFNVLCEFRLSEQRQRVAFDSDEMARVAEQLAQEEEPPEEVWDQRARERWLDAALEELPPMQRAVFLLAIRHDVPHRQIADRLGLSMHTVRKYLYRTLHHCRQKLSEHTTKGNRP